MLGATTTTITTATTTTTTLEQMLLSRHTQQVIESNLTAMTELPMNLAGSKPEVTAPTTYVFTPTACLFCNAASSTLEDNYQHMYKHHGLFVPDKERLVVDLETLLEYLHLVVFEYRECLFCNATRRTAQAAQQHMTGTGHCKFDIASEDSEFRDFYDFESDNSGVETDEEEENDDDDDDEEEEEEEEGEVEGQSKADNESSSKSAPVQVDDTSIRLPSGKIVSNRSVPTPRHPSRQPLKTPASRAKSQLTSVPAAETTTESEPSTSTSRSPSSSSKALEKKDRQASSLAVRLAGMRANDQRALAHLPVSEQRALLTQTLRQEARADRAQRQFRGRMDSYGNLKSKERFVNDVPGGKSHKNRFMAQ